MKKNYLFLGMIALSVFGLFSCNKPDVDEEKEPVEKNLPTIEDMVIAPGAEAEVSFYAYDVWTVEADKEWLTVEPNSGEKGDVKVVLKAADEFAAEDQANVKIVFGENVDEVAFNVKRSEKVRTLTFEKASSEEVSSLTFGPDALEQAVQVSANFKWELEDTNWPAWLIKPEVTEGTLDETSKLYKGVVTLKVDEEQIVNFYEQKEAVLTFIDIDAIDVNYTLNVSHTFEKPVPTNVISSEFGQVLTLGTDGKFKESGSNTVTLTLNPNEGEENFQVYQIYAWNNLLDNTRSRAASAVYAGEKYVELTNNNNGTYTLKAVKYPGTFQINGGDSTASFTMYFFIPNSIWGTWMSMAQTPDNAIWWAFNNETLTDPYTMEVKEDYATYTITVNVEN